MIINKDDNYLKDLHGFQSLRRPKLKHEGKMSNMIEEEMRHNILTITRAKNNLLRRAHGYLSSLEAKALAAQDIGEGEH